MANSNTPFGFRPVRMLDGSPWNGQGIRCVIASGDGTATFIGDAVKLAGSSVTGYPTVIQAAAGNEIFGVVTSFEPNRADLTATYRLASTERYCNVVPALDAVFEIQSSGTPTAGSVGELADITVGSGGTASGISAMQLDTSTSSSSAATLQILGFVDRPDNEIGQYAKVLVRISESSLRGDGTGV
jgi:hypothetical protein